MLFPCFVTCGEGMLFVLPYAQDVRLKVKTHCMPCGVGKILYGIQESDEVVRRLFRYKFSSFADLWDMCLRMGNRIDVNLMTIIFWQIWNRRN